MVILGAELLQALLMRKQILAAAAGLEVVLV
jgi:hypothetical protein